MATNGFTKIDNSIIFDSSLSLEALGLYIKLSHFSNIDNFSIKRDYIKSISGYGETAFRRVWKELKDKGLLIETKENNKGRYKYSYILKANKNTTKVNDQEENKKHLDSDGNAPIDGQVYIDEVIEETENKDIELIEQKTNFNKQQIKELLKVANNNIEKIIESYNYTIEQDKVKNVFSYTKWVIKNSKSFSKYKRQDYRKDNFNNYQQRNYDFAKLERALLYGEEYELPA